MLKLSDLPRTLSVLTLMKNLRRQPYTEWKSVFADKVCHALQQMMRVHTLMVALLFCRKGGSGHRLSGGVRRCLSSVICRERCQC
jgi:hypothetical protein